MASPTKSFGPKPVLYGSTKMGARGQVVVPVRARRDFRLKDGDELLVAGMQGRFLLFLKLSDLGGVVSELTERVRIFQQMLTKTKVKSKK